MEKGAAVEIEQHNAGKLSDSVNAYLQLHGPLC